MTFYNLATCSGWTTKSTSYIATGSCMKARIGIIILFFIIAILRRWGGEELGIGFSFLFSLISGLGSYILIIMFSGSMKFAFFIGIILAVLFGYGAGLFFGDEGGEY